MFAFEIEKIPLKFNPFLDFNTRPERIFLGVGSLPASKPLS